MTTKIQLKDAYKTYTHDQDKILPPDETIRRLKDKLKRLDIDILDRTVRIDKGRLDIPVFFSYCGNDAAELTGTKKQMGKGATPEQAEASAVMELAERFSFFSFASNPTNFIAAQFDEISKDAISFESIAKSVHDESPDLEAAQRIFETLPMKWTKAYNLTSQKELMIPFDWFYTINAFSVLPLAIVLKRLSVRESVKSSKDIHPQLSVTISIYARPLILTLPLIQWLWRCFTNIIMQVSRFILPIFHLTSVFPQLVPWPMIHQHFLKRVKSSGQLVQLPTLKKR